jgi:hypothetical protein
MAEDVEIIHSPLEQTYSADGHSRIFRFEVSRQPSLMTTHAARNRCAKLSICSS